MGRVRWGDGRGGGWRWSLETLALHHGLSAVGPLPGFQPSFLPLLPSQVWEGVLESALPSYPARGGPETLPAQEGRVIQDSRAPLLLGQGHSRREWNRRCKDSVLLRKALTYKLRDWAWAQPPPGSPHPRKRDGAERAPTQAGRRTQRAWAPQEAPEPSWE